VPVGVRDDEEDMVRRAHHYRHHQSGSTEDEIRFKLDLTGASESQPRLWSYDPLICRNIFVGLFLMCKLRLQVVSSQRMPADSFPILRHPYHA
jgi:hypothetical protein